MAQNFFEQLRHWLRAIVKNFSSSSKRLKDQVRTEFQFHGQRSGSFPGWRKWRYLGRVLTPAERLRLRAILLVLFLSLIFLGGRAYYRFSEIAPASGGEYVEGLVGAPQFINPVLALANETDLDLTRLVFSGLVRYDQQEGFVSDLAERFEISSDGKTYTFNLRRDVLWHDGEPFTADDVVFTVRTIQNSKIKSPLFGSFSGVTVEKVDGSTVRFQLQEPFSPFLSILTVGILPSHLWYDVPAQQFALNEYNVKPVGTGPYSFRSLKKDRQGLIRSYTFGAFDRYHKSRPFIDIVTFKFYADQNESVAALKNGSVDGIGFLSGHLRGELERQTSISLHELSLPQYTALFFNGKKNIQLENQELRAALTQAIDVKTLASKVLSGSAIPIHGPLLPGTLGYDETFIGADYQPVEAERLLDKLGWKKVTADELRKRDEERKAKGVKAQADSAPQGEAGQIIEKPADEAMVDPWAEQETYRESKGNILTVTLTTVDHADNRLTAEIIQDFWQAIGVRTMLEFAPRENIQQDVIQPRAYEILLFGEILGGDSDPYPFWHSSQREHPGLNLTSFESRQVDRLLEEGRKQTDPVKRAETNKKFQEELNKQNVAVFLYNPLYIYPMSKKVRGFTNERIAAPADRFTNTEEWYIKTKRRLW